MKQNDAMEGPGRVDGGNPYDSGRGVNRIMRTINV